MMGYKNPGAEMKLTMPVMEDHANCPRIPVLHARDDDRCLFGGLRAWLWIFSFVNRGL